MREVNYNFNGEIQKRVAYTKDEVLNDFKIRANDIDGQTFWIDRTLIRMDMTLSRKERISKLAKVVDKLKDMLCDDEYLDIEVMNIAYNLLDLNALADTVANHKKVWNNVIK